MERFAQKAYGIPKNADCIYMQMMVSWIEGCDGEEVCLRQKTFLKCTRHECCLCRHFCHRRFALG